MPRWLLRILQQIHALAAAGAVRLTYKAEREALLLDLSPEDVRDVVAGLGGEGSAGRLVSEPTGEWMYVFKPRVGAQIIYVKLLLRAGCVVVVSFHEDEGGDHEEENE